MKLALVSYISFDYYFRIFSIGNSTLDIELLSI